MFTAFALTCLVTLHHQAEGTTAGCRQRSTGKQQEGHFDPFQQFSLAPFDVGYDSHGSSSGTVTGTASPASSMHLDDGLVSSCDPASCEFLLFALALHDQSFSAQQNHQTQLQHHPGVRSLTASMPPSQTGPCHGLCTLTRTCAGALDAMLTSDCAQTGMCYQHDAAGKHQAHLQQQKKEDSGALDHSHCA